MITASAIAERCAELGRVCPMPMRWNELWELLPDRQRVGLGWEPALPLILAAWHDASDSSKFARFKEHLDWAEAHGALEEVSALLDRLGDDEWLSRGQM